MVPGVRRRRRRRETAGRGAGGVVLAEESVIEVLWRTAPAVDGDNEA